MVWYVAGLIFVVSVEPLWRKQKSWKEALRIVQYRHHIKALFTLHFRNFTIMTFKYSSNTCLLVLWVTFSATVYKRKPMYVIL